MKKLVIFIVLMMLSNNKYNVCENTNILYKNQLIIDKTIKDMENSGMFY